MNQEFLAIFISVVTAMNPSVHIPEPRIVYSSQALSEAHAYGETVPFDTVSTVILRDNFDPTNSFDIKIIKHEFCHVVLNAENFPPAKKEAICKKLYPVESRIW